MMNNQKSYEKLNQLIHAYVPEFSFDEASDDPGSVLSVLCADMIGDSRKRFERVFDKHKIQYLNLLDDLKSEPVKAAKGYVQFDPVLTYDEQSVFVPKKTQVMAQKAETGNIIFETTHDMSATHAKPVAVIETDREKDVIIRQDPAESGSFQAFSIEGENEAEHKLYLCFEDIFDYVTDLSFDLILTGKNKDYEEKRSDIVTAMTKNTIKWYLLDPDGNAVMFDCVRPHDHGIHFEKENYTPQKTAVMQKEGYYIVASRTGDDDDFYIDTVQIAMKQENRIPDAVFVNGLEDNISKVYPFGKPLGLYNELTVENKEVLSKKGAEIVLEFDLDYIRHEERLDVQEADIEYKNFMKKPQKTMMPVSSQVLADYVVWEYLSTTGWKRLFREEHLSTMFNGTKKGHIKLQFTCPGDMENYQEGEMEGRLRVRLLRAENIYKMPAVYVCPIISGMMLSYHYESMPYADYACTSNNFDVVDITHDLRDNKIIVPFYSNELNRRTMYLCFDNPPSGTPVSIYFDLENLSDRPITFSVQYLSDRGFQTIKVTDSTNGFLGSGNMLLMIPDDMKKQRLYGEEGYFIRFVNYDAVHPQFALPYIRGIYMNMAKVENVNVEEEVFYLDHFDTAADITLSQQNLLRADVYVKEIINGEGQYVPWKPAAAVSDEERVYHMDMAQGILHIDKRVMLNTDFDKEGPQIKVRHSNYNGSEANLPENSIIFLRNAVRFISSVRNPFPTYGGHDGYTQEISEKLITGLLRTRNRAVTEQDFYDIIAQSTFGVRKVKCVSGIDLFGAPDPDVITVAVLIDEYEKGVHIFSELKDELRKKLEEQSFVMPMGRRLVLTQPRFVKFSVRVWIERDSMEGAYDVQNKASEVIYEFLDPLKCEKLGISREIGELPRTSQIISALRANIPDCNISKIVMTAQLDGKEIPIKDDFYRKYETPFIMGINGKHVVHIDLI